MQLTQEIFDIGDRIFVVTGVGTIDDPLFVAMLGVEQVQIYYNSAGHRETVVQYETAKATYSDFNVYDTPDDAEHGMNTWGIRSIGDRGGKLAYYSSVMGYTVAETGWDTPPGPDWILTGN